MEKTYAVDYEEDEVAAGVEELWRRWPHGFLVQTPCSLPEQQETALNSRHFQACSQRQHTLHFAARVSF